MTTPFLKCAGGKRKLLPKLIEGLPPSYKSYYEPFVGGGALFFYLEPDDAYLSDLNPYFIAAYGAVRQDVSKVLEELWLLNAHHSAAQYDSIRRSLKPIPEQAARIIYINRTCFNGLFRVNKQGMFNVPMGKDMGEIVQEDILYDAWTVLQKASIRHEDFETALRQVPPTEGDLVYFDPPYLPVRQGSFTNYHQAGFGLADHERLAKVFRELTDRGVYCILSNSECEATWKLYRDFHCRLATRPGTMNSKASARGRVAELIIQNFPPPKESTHGQEEGHQEDGQEEDSP